MEKEHSKDKVSRKSKGVKKTGKEFWFYTVGFLLAFVPYVSMVVLQSSINIEEGVGTFALGIAYIAALLVSMFVTPFALRRFGSKRVLVFGELLYFLYIAANFYPKMYIMLTAGIIVGIGEGMIWTIIPLYCWHFGYLHGQFGSKQFEFYVQKYMAMFWAVFQISQIFGNAISYAVLFGSKNKTDDDQFSENFTEIVTLTPNSYQHCGSNDCQISNTTKENIDSYVPANTTSLYLLISIFCAMNLIGVGFHIRFLSNAIPKEAESVEVRRGSEIDNESQKKTDQNIASKVKSDYNFKSTLQATFRHLTEVKQVLITPLVIYNGLMICYIISEAIRAYVSCILGVEQVGAVMILFLVTDGIASAIAGKLIRRFGRNKIMFATLLVTISNYLFGAFWKITEETKYLVYMTYFFFGCMDCFWRYCTFDIYTWYFPHSQEISYTIWNFWATFGFAAGFLWSPMFCISTKIYIQIGLLVFSLILYVYFQVSQNSFIENQNLRLMYHWTKCAAENNCVVQ